MKLLIKFKSVNILKIFKEESNYPFIINNKLQQEIKCDLFISNDICQQNSLKFSIIVIWIDNLSKELKIIRNGAKNIMKFENKEKLNKLINEFESENYDVKIITNCDIEDSEYCK